MVGEASTAVYVTETMTLIRWSIINNLRFALEVYLSVYASQHQSVIVNSVFITQRIPTYLFSLLHFH